MADKIKNERQFYFYDEAYSKSGFSAQRRYPNEELCRFMGRNFFHLPFSDRKEVKVLEVGCGSGANLWMIAREGFDAYGIDLVESGVKLCEEMLKNYESSASLKTGDMTETGYGDNTFDVVADVFSSYCLTRKDGARFLDEVFRILKPGGLFFSYFPSKNSDTFLKSNHPDPSYKQMLDGDTLNGLHRIGGPYVGNDYAFRFMDRDGYAEMAEAAHLKVTYCEQVGRTYRGGDEYFEFLVLEASKEKATK